MVSFSHLEKTGRAAAQEIPPPARYESVFGKSPIAADLIEETYAAREIETYLMRKTERIQLRHRRQVHTASLSVTNRAHGAGSPDAFRLSEVRALGRPLVERGTWLDALLLQAAALTESAPFTPAPGRHFLLVSPVVGSVLLEKLIGWFRADAVQAGTSPLVARQGKPLFSSVISIVDNGNFPGAPSAAPFDMEGARTQETTIVAQGILHSLLYDTYAATRENRLSTGNFLRGPDDAAPRIGASHTYFTPSTYRPGDLCKAMGEGYILQSVDSMKPVSGSETEFQVTGSGWRVGGGSCIEPVRNVRFAFDIFDLFSRAVEIGNDLSFHGGCGAPSILFENIPLSQ